MPKTSVKEKTTSRTMASGSRPNSNTAMVAASTPNQHASGEPSSLAGLESSLPYPLNATGALFPNTGHKFGDVGVTVNAVADGGTQINGIIFHGNVRDLERTRDSSMHVGSIKRGDGLQLNGCKLHLHGTATTTINWKNLVGNHVNPKTERLKKGPNHGDDDADERVQHNGPMVTWPSANVNGAR